MAANGNERADLIEPTLTVRAENAVVADFDATGRQDMLEEPPKELDGRNRRALQLLATVVAEAEDDLAVFNAFDAAVGDGDAEDVSTKIIQDFFTRAGVLAVHHR